MTGNLRVPRSEIMLERRQHEKDWCFIVQFFTERKQT